MKNSSQEFSLDAHSLPCGVMVVSQNRDIVNCNQYVTNSLSAARSEVVGQRIDKVVTAASRIFLDSYVYPLLMERSKIDETQINLKNFTGEKLPVPVIANIISKPDGSTVWTFMRCESRDKLYEELITTRNCLSDQAKELKTLNEQSQNERDDLEVFCRSLSHDFTAPILTIKQLVTFAMEDLQSKDLAVDTELEMLKQSIKSAAALMKLINGLVEYLTAGVHAPIDEVVDLQDIVAAAIDMFEDSEAVNITVNTLPTVIGHTAQLQIIFKNLIGNAIKYNQRKPEIALSCKSSSREGYVTLSVEDNGIGMSPQYLEKIFEPFSRLHGSSEYCGSGLGLSIVKKLVSNHKGYITVKSALETGSTFFIELPLANNFTSH